MDSTVVTVRTGERFTTDLTDDVRGYVSGLGDGLVNVFVPHATAGIAVIELHAGSEEDLAATVDRILPREDVYVHRHGSVGHGRDHVLPAFVGPSLTLPVLGGRLLLGTWQSVVLVDPNVDNAQRKVRLSFLAG